MPATGDHSMRLPHLPTIIFTNRVRWNRFVRKLSTRPGMHMVRVAMMMIVYLYRYNVQPAMTHFVFGHEAIGETGHFTGRPTQDDCLHAIVVVQVHVHRGQHQVMVFMLKTG